MSLLNFSRHTAVFLDKSGRQVGKKIFAYSWNNSRGLKKKVFDYLDGSYNVKTSDVVRMNVSFRTDLIFDDYFYIYNLNNPDPVECKFGDFKPLMEADIYKTRLKSKLVHDLNRAGKNGFDIPWKYVLIALAAILVLIYFINGGTLLGGKEVVTEAVNNVVQSAPETVPR